MSLKPGDQEARSEYSASKANDVPGAFPTTPTQEKHAPGISAPQSLSAAVNARKDEFVRQKTIKVKVGTWNVASGHAAEKDLGAWFIKGLGSKGLSQDLAGLSIDNDPNAARNKSTESVEEQEERFNKKKSTYPQNDSPAGSHSDEIGLYVLGLQEIVDISSVTEAVKPYTDPYPAKRWKSAIEESLPSGYEKVAEQQLLGLLILIYASPEVLPNVSSVDASSVGTGLMGYLGNKGAVSVRLLLGEATRLCFVNCHLAAGADQAALNRRIWDTQQILNRTRFTPISIDGDSPDAAEEKIGDEDFAFWFGDLNYRLDDIPGEDVRRLLLLHTRNEYDIANKSKRKIDSELGYVNAPSGESSNDDGSDMGSADEDNQLDPKTDPASLHTTLQSLLAHDQLRTQQKLRKAFHEGWREGDISFLPTYKYDIGSVGMFDSGEKKRSPSWCDRILFRTRRDLEQYTEKVKAEIAARKKDEEMKKRGIDKAVAEQDVLFDYDPDVDGLAYGEDYEDEEAERRDAELVQTLTLFEDEIEVDHYISHQRILSSDHKPLDAIFRLKYNAVIPELKARVHQEVARELDKVENESRPTMAVVVDNQSDATISKSDQADSNSIHFGEVRFNVKKARGITIANTGQIAATFYFMDKSENDHQQDVAIPDWLQLNAFSESEWHHIPSEHSSTKAYTLQPGDTMTVEVSIEISTPDLISRLNQGHTLLEDILVLRIVDGRDHFIPVKGKWMPTCFYQTLNRLVAASDSGIRLLPISTNDKGLTSSTSRQGSHSAPREVFMLTEAIPGLVERSVADWEMIHGEETPPWKSENNGLSWPFLPATWTYRERDNRLSMLDRVREALDTGVDPEKQFAAEVPSLARLEILAETLITFLSSLRDGIVQQEVWTDIDQQILAAEQSKESSDQRIREIVTETMSTSPVHSVSFTILTYMLTRIINELAPISPGLSKSLRTKRSRTSTLSSDPDSQPTSPSTEGSMKRALLQPFRRRRHDASSSSFGESDVSSAAIEKHEELVKCYSEVFGPIMIRSDQDARVKGREKKALDNRKRRVVEAFLEAP